MNATVRITPVIWDEIQYTVADSLGRFEEGTITDQTDYTYVKIGQAPESKGGYIKFEANDADIKELRDRAMFNIEKPYGTCWQNLEDAYDPMERNYWRSRIRAYQSLIKQLDGLQRN